MANNHNDYEELASLLYPSIEASGNVYYGQTRKLAIDELFSINDGGFESNIKTIRRQTDSNEDGFEYISYFCWKFGPLNGRIRIAPCDNDKFIFTFANFPELEKIYHLDDTYVTNDSKDPIVGTLFIRYKLLLNDNTVEHILNSGTFNSYEKLISLDTNDIRVYITDNCDPTNVDNRDIDDRNIFVKRENDAYYLFVKLCKCADVKNPGDALYFINMNDGESTVKLIVNGDLQTDYEYYKSSIIGWEKYTAGDVITLANRNDKVYFRGSRSQQGFDNYIQFNMTGKLSACGNINSLLSPDESVYKNITDYTTFETANGQTFYRLFFNQTSLYDVSALKLSTNKLSITCYGDMFFGCTSLINAPELPATDLANECYMSMFCNCTSLNQAPVLQATLLEHSCYMSMFENCTSLVQAPILPSAFSADYCYRWMFNGCAKLNYIKCLMTYTSATGCTDDWLANTASIGTFECDNKKYFTIDSPSGIPVGWTITEINPDPPEPVKPEIDTFDPELPFCIENIGNVPVEIGLYNHSANTTVRRDCKISRNLDTWSDYTLALTEDNTSASISKITLANKGDRVYFKATINSTPSEDHYTHFTVLNESTNTKIRAGGNIMSLTLGTNDAYKTEYFHLSVQYGYYWLFKDCASLTQLIELPSTSLSDNCYGGMFRGCTNLNKAPLLPATSLAEYCYREMFRDCINLSQAPELPASLLKVSCYARMFYGCEGLKYVKCLATDVSAFNCLFNWLLNIPSTGTFECDNKKYFTIDSPSGIPVGWTITELNPDPVKPEIDTFDPNVPFCIENMGDVPVEVGLYNHSTGMQVRTNCKISYDLETWQNYSLALAINPKDSLIGKITLTNKGDRVYIKADLTGTSNNSNYTHLTVLNESANTKIRVRGNIASIDKGTNDVYKTDYLTVAAYCYRSMFKDCTSLTQAPELPATTLGNNCYESMFNGCTSLVKATGSLATTLADYCCYSMFNGCTSLTQAPALPATTLKVSCYTYMFYRCVSLTRAPELPAITLTSMCYNSMFASCDKLNYIKCLATDISADSCTTDWVNSIAYIGNFYTPASTNWPSGNSGIPAVWTRHDI